MQISEVTRRVDENLLKSLRIESGTLKSGDVKLDFFAGSQATAMRLQTFEKLPGEVQDAVMESAYTTQIWVQGCNEAGLARVVGNTVPQFPNTVYAKHGVRVAKLSPEALKEAEEMCSPQHHPKEWEAWRERLNGWSGGLDTYKMISEIAREVPAGREAINVEPRRWWRS